MKRNLAGILSVQSRQFFSWFLQYPHLIHLDVSVLQHFGLRVGSEIDFWSENLLLLYFIQFLLLVISLIFLLIRLGLTVAQLDEIHIRGWFVSFIVNKVGNLPTFGTFISFPEFVVLLHEDVGQTFE